MPLTQVLPRCGWLCQRLDVPVWCVNKLGPVDLGPLEEDREQDTRVHAVDGDAQLLLKISPWKLPAPPSPLPASARPLQSSLPSLNTCPVFGCLDSSLSPRGPEKVLDLPLGFSVFSFSGFLPSVRGEFRISSESQLGSVFLHYSALPPHLQPRCSFNPRPHSDTDTSGRG